MKYLEILKKKGDMMIEELACSLGRNDEKPNIILAMKLAESGDTKGISEIAEGISNKDKAIVNDCIKVLYEIGNKKPELIATYVDVFLEGILSKNNRLAWGSMTALAEIADLRAKEIFEKIGNVYRAYKVGSVITVDQSMSVLAKLCKADPNYEKEIFPFLLKHLSTCRAKEIPQHTERISICINEENRERFIEIINSRRNELTTAQEKRVNQIIKKLMK